MVKGLLFCLLNFLRPRQGQNGGERKPVSLWYLCGAELFGGFLPRILLRLSSWLALWDRSDLKLFISNGFHVVLNAWNNCFRILILPSVEVAMLDFDHTVNVDVPVRFERNRQWRWTKHRENFLFFLIRRKPTARRRLGDKFFLTSHFSQSHGWPAPEIEKSGAELCYDG